uniref:Uncharacterized protein n=1 Tax=Anopheles quadriannulatus TaxID=34691 RepID=A0A182XRM2_ANOQN
MGNSVESTNNSNSNSSNSKAAPIFFLLYILSTPHRQTDRADFGGSAEGCDTTEPRAPVCCGEPQYLRGVGWFCRSEGVQEASCSLSYHSLTGN